MTWKDHDHHDDDPYRDFGKPGGDWHGMRPSFDNPMTWAVRLGRISGITVRVHLLLLLFIIVMLLRSVSPAEANAALTAPTFRIMLIAMASLFMIVLCHEFGHCIACRSVGGVADEILMWPLGGLARCMPPNRWQAHFITVIGGPLVNVIICIVAGTMLFIDTGVFWGVAIPNPLDPLGPIYEGVLAGWPAMTLFIINWISFLLLLFNLLPIFPLDGGQILQSLLWPRMGYARSMRFAVRAGLIGAIVLAVWAFVASDIMVLAIALFGLITCYITGKQLKFTEEFMGYEADALSSSYTAPEPEKVSRAAERREARRRERAVAEQKALDAILEKIQSTGIESLTRKEKRLLEKATKEKRKG